MSGRLDAHQHFWDPAVRDYPWMTDAVAAIRRPYRPEDLRPHLERHAIEATVAVQAVSEEAETRELCEIARRTSFVAGVVGWVDLASPACAARLEELACAELVGIRHQVQDEPDARWLLRDDVSDGLRCVQEAGMVFDLLVTPRQLEAAVEAVRRHPELRFVLNHMAKPPIAAGADDGWAHGIEHLAAFGNAWCKVSGMVTEADWERWRPEDLRPYIDRVLAAFGPERLMFGSDWPVCLLAADYDEVVAVVEGAVSELSADERDAIFGATARAVYGLG